MPDRTILTPTEARQASPRRMNFRVLLFSLGLAIFVAAMLYYAFYAGSSSFVSKKPIAEQPTTNEPVEN